MTPLLTCFNNADGCAQVRGRAAEEKTVRCLTLPASCEVLGGKLIIQKPRATASRDHLGCSVAPVVSCYTLVEHC